VLQALQVVLVLLGLDALNLLFLLDFDVDFYFDDIDLIVIQPALLLNLF